MNLRKGYTLVELLIFIAIFTVVIGAFISMLVISLRLQARQSSAGSVQQESTALLQQLQYYVENSSLVNIPIDTSTTTLSLRMSSTTLDPTTVTVSASGTVYLKQGSGTSTALTSNRVKVTGLTFVRHTNPPSHDTVSISFTMANNSPNIQQLFSQSFQTAITQVSAATFDSNIVPSSSATYNLGVSGSVWSSVNNVIYFSGSNVGIGTNAPQATLDVHSGNIFVDTVGNGLKLRDSTGACWLVTPNASGTLGTASVSCSAP